MTRADCIAWLKANNLEVPPKSSCVFCPYHGIEVWKDMKRKGGDDWSRAVEVDGMVRRVRRDFDLFVHPARVPLEEAVNVPAGDLPAEFEFDRPCDGGVCFT